MQIYDISSKLLVFCKACKLPFRYSIHHIFAFSNGYKKRRDASVRTYLLGGVRKVAMLQIRLRNLTPMNVSPSQLILVADKYSGLPK